MINTRKGNPSYPRSNVACVGAYDPDKYALVDTPFTVLTDEALTPNRPPCLTQRTVGIYLRPLTRELDEQPPRPTVDELPDAVIDRLVRKDKAFWVDKPGSNDYVLHDAYYRCGMTTDQILPTHQDVFPRSYQYDLDCVKYRRLHACDALKQSKGAKMAPYCRECGKLSGAPPPSPFQETDRKRWRYYPKLTAKLTKKELQASMKEVGQPFRSEACNWYYKNYPSMKYDFILRKFSK